MSIFLALAAAAAQPMPAAAEAEARIVAADARLFWAAFEACEPAVLDELLLPEFRMIHDKAGLAVENRAAFVASLSGQCAARAPGGDNAGYRNRRLAVPGTRVLRRMGEWGMLEEGAHTFHEWRGEGRGWEQVGGARYMHLWRWMPEEGAFRLAQSYSYDHGAAEPYPPADAGG